MNLAIVETQQRVGVDPDLTTRFRWRAERRCRRLNAALRVPFYRWEVVRERVHRGRFRWAVVAMQNLARPQ